MGTHDDPDPARPAEERAGETAEHRHPARPEQTDEGYATGFNHEPDSPEQELEPDFARGRAETDPHKHGRFSTSEEKQLPDSPEELEPDFARGRAETDPHKHGRFSTGEEQLPDSPEKDVERRFSEGVERSPTSE